MPPVISSWRDAILAALAEALRVVLAGIPVIIGALVILIIGWIIAGIFNGLTIRLLRALRFDQIADKAGLDEFIERTGVKLSPTEVIGLLVKWFVRIIALVAAADTLNVPQVSVFLSQILGYLPNVIAAVLILILGALVARFVADVVKGAASSADLAADTANLLSGVTYWAILLVTIMAAIEQLGVARVLSGTVLTGIVGAVALTAALSFGLGCKELAGDIIAGRALQTNISPKDKITVGEHSGTVEKVGATSLVLDTPSGKVILPNTEVARSTVIKS